VQLLVGGSEGFAGAKILFTTRVILTAHVIQIPATTNKNAKNFLLGPQNAYVRMIKRPSAAMMLMM